MARPALSERLVGVVEALADARVIVPLYPHARPDTLEQAREESAALDDAGVTTVALDATRQAMAVFSSVDALAAYDPQARPAPLSVRRACLMAVAGPARLLLDGSLAIPRPAVAALAQGDTWLPAWADTELGRLIDDALADLGISGVRLEPAELARDRIIVPIAAGTEDVRARLTEATRRLGSLERLIVATDTIEVAPVRAAGRRDGEHTRDTRA
nr:SseB family protein [Nanchangia anserum]